MNLNLKKYKKDQIQKISLSALGFVGLIYCYFTFFLGPLNRSRESMTATIADLQVKTASSKTEVKKTANLEIQAKAATGRYEALKATTEEGAPIAWFPPKMRIFFGGYGIDKAAVRLESSTEYKQPELSDWLKDTWAVDLPQCDYNDLGIALASLENSEPLSNVQKIVVHAVPDQPQRQQVNLVVQTALLKK